MNISEKKKLNTTERFRENIQHEIFDQHKRARSRVSRWNLYFYGSIILGIILSAFVAATAQLADLNNGQFAGLDWKDIISISALVATILTSLIHVIGIEKRWQASRNRLAKTHQLKNEILDPDFAPKDIKERLNRIIEQYNQESGIASKVPEKF